MTPQDVAGLRPQARSMDSLLEKLWARLLVPSLSDLFFLAVLVWLFSAGSSGWQGLLADADVGWHIRTGEYVLDHTTVPSHDLYSFSKPGATWYAWEWLTDVTDALLFRWAGLKGVVLAAAVLISLFATTLVRRMTWRGVHLLVAMLVAFLGVGASSMHFLARPHVFTLLFLSGSVWMIESDRRKASNRIWLLVPLTVVWTNMHGGFLALVAVLGVTAVGSAMEVLLEAPPELRLKPEGLLASLRGGLRYGYLTLACLAASLVNPFGWRLHQHVIEYLRSTWIRDVVEEFQSPSFRNENVMQFEVLMLVGLIAAGGLFKRKRIVEGLWIVFWVHMSLGSVRHVPVFITVTIPVIAAEVALWWQGWTEGAARTSLAGILNQISADAGQGFRRTSLIPFAAVLALMVMGEPIKWPRDFPELLFPTKLIHAHEDIIFDKKVLTTDQWADYLIFLHPTQKVYVDGRSDFYGQEVGNEYIRLLNGGKDWAKTLETRGFETALISTDLALAQLLKQRSDWQVVAEEGKRILLVRTSVPVRASR